MANIERVPKLCKKSSLKSAKSISIESIDNYIFPPRKKELMEILHRSVSKNKEVVFSVPKIFKQPQIHKLKESLRDRWLESPEVKSKLLASIPNLTSDELRRHHIPYNEAVLLELEESNLYETAAYLKMLFQLEEKLRNNADRGSTVWKNQSLKDNHEFVDKLRYSLTMLTESGDPAARAEIMLDIAIYFQSRSWEWWWIAEFLFRNALHLSKYIVGDDKKLVAIIPYMYARFVFNNMNDPELALGYLQFAKKHSEGQSWDTTEFLGIRQQSLYMECCSMLCDVLLKIARNVQETNPDLAVQACLDVICLAKRCGYEEKIAYALVELGKSELKAGQIQDALQHLNKFITLATKISDYDGLCRGHKHLAFLYKELDDVDNTAKHLRKFEEIAEKHELPYKFAQANYFIGEHLLGLNDPKSATPHLEKAFFTYSSLGAREEADRARCLAGVSKGQEMMATYQRLLLKCGEPDFESLSQICEWKNTGNPIPIVDDDSVYGGLLDDTSEDTSNPEEENYILSDDEIAFDEPSASVSQH